MPQLCCQGLILLLVEPSWEPWAESELEPVPELEPELLEDSPARVFSL